MLAEGHDGEATLLLNLGFGWPSNGPGSATASGKMRNPWHAHPVAMAGLPDDVVADFEAWVNLGAPDPRTVQTTVKKQVGLTIEEGRKFWAYRPPVKPSVPAVRDSAWPVSDIDRFLLAGLEAKGLRPAAEADRQTLVRRVYFDLIGLPPTIEEMERALGDKSEDWLEKLVEQLNPERSLDHTPLFQTMFLLQNTPRAALTMKGLEIEWAQVDNRASIFDLTVSLQQAAGGLDGFIEYSSDLFDERTARKLGDRFNLLLEGIAADPDRRLSRLPIMDAHERDRILDRLRERGVRNLIVLTADVHHAELIRHEPAPGFVFHEFIAGPLSATLGRPRPLVNGLPQWAIDSGQTYHIAPDGDRFLMMQWAAVRTGSNELRIIFNWFGDLRRAMAAR